MESWCKSQRVWMRAMSFHAKNMGWIGQIQSFVTGKWIITCVFMHPKKNRNNMKIQISFCGGVWSRICPQCEDSGQSRRSCCIAKWCISCKITLPRPVGGSGERSVCADGQFVRGQNPSMVHGASLYIRRGGRTAQFRKQAADFPGNSRKPRMYSMIAPM